jgi:Sap, sulfolipid-1-addressing protein
VSLDVIVLALASVPRPAGLAALYALLSARHPRRVLVSYVVAGFVFSVAVGVVLVTIFRGADIHHGGTTLNALIELVAGAAALGYAVGVSTGRAQPPSRRETSSEESAMIQRLRNPSMLTAALAGVATHLPGLFYLVALNAIVADGGSVANGIFQVLVFNVIWFGAAFYSTVVFLIRPGAGRRALSHADAWARRHARGMTIAVFALVGLYLFVKGTVNLLD